MAETNGPERPEAGQGIKGWFFRLAQSHAGGAVPSANQHVDSRVTPQKFAARREGHCPRLRARKSRGAAWAHFRYGLVAARALPRRHFIGEHGPWNRKPFNGYKVVFVPFADGHPSDQPKDVLTGFLTKDGEARGRPVGVAIDGSGALLVADDVGNTIWRVSGEAHSAPLQD